MTVAVFEAATIIDVIKRAAKAAPQNSDLSDNMRSAGLVIDVQPANQYAVIRTTNEKVYYREVVDTLECEGDRVTWRLSSGYLSRMIATFKSHSGSIVRFAQVGGLVEITQDRKKGKLGMMDATGYPEWFDTQAEEADTAVDLGAKLKLLDWAIDSAVPSINGYRITREAIYTTNRYVMARVPNALPGLVDPITLQAGFIEAIIDQRGDMAFKVIGGQVLLVPNDRTQIRTATIGEPFPPIETAMRYDYPNSLYVNRDEFLQLIKTTESVQAKDKACVLRLFIGDEQVAGVMEQADEPTGIRDIIDVTGAVHEMCELDFNPSFIGQAIGHAPDEYVTMRYDRHNARTVILIDTNSGYQCWVTPIDMKRRAH